jgi:hypothetical protein
MAQGKTTEASVIFKEYLELPNEYPISRAYAYLLLAICQIDNDLLHKAHFSFGVAESIFRQHFNYPIGTNPLRDNLPVALDTYSNFVAAKYFFAIGLHENCWEHLVTAMTQYDELYPINKLSADRYLEIQLGMLYDSINNSRINSETCLLEKIYQDG